MRLFAIVPLAALAACGGGGEPKQEAPAAAEAVEAGQWQSTVEVTNFRQADAGRPRLNLPVGTRLEGGACVTPADASRPPPQLFVGEGFENCRWGDNFYLSAGRLVSSMTCQRDGVGQVEVTVNVDFTADSYQGTVEMLTRLVSDGDVVIAARGQGRRTGACTADSQAGKQTETR